MAEPEYTPEFNEEDSKSRDELLREIAEKIVAGEFKVCAISMINLDDTTTTYHTGGRITAIGLFTHGAHALLNQTE